MLLRCSAPAVGYQQLALPTASTCTERCQSRLEVYLKTRCNAPALVSELLQRKHVMPCSSASPAELCCQPCVVLGEGIEARIEGIDGCLPLASCVDSCRVGCKLQ